MKEFGSDFHYLPIVGEGAEETIGHYYPDAVYYATGRQALIDLYRQMGWKRIWMPEYFCYDVLGCIESEGLNIAFYTDYPLFDEAETVNALPFEEGDVLFRVNYFGLRLKRSNYSIPVPVVEDHTHDLIGEWAMNSDADWCIASLRKTLPLAEGGMLWSPKGLQIQLSPELTRFNMRVASRRWKAMRNKSLYLEDRIADKNVFRTVMLSTEEELDSMKKSALDQESFEYLSQFDVRMWYQRKRDNWAEIKDIKNNVFTVLEPEGSGCFPFSLILLFNDENDRNQYRISLIQKNVYPAILWSIPSGNHHEVTDFSKRLLSIHCDARYSRDDMAKLQSIINGC